MMTVIMHAHLLLKFVNASFSYFIACSLVAVSDLLATSAVYVVPISLVL